VIDDYNLASTIEPQELQADVGGEKLDEPPGGMELGEAQ
jgi:hypothetical protein